ncbi:hypothetical protein CTEN210_12286 [Chaetoceros tenuissimus]|uniref:Uncharacterized protein n=1 Tax=Chaetoceros tenuissimus TaxID=426638 RepID=A0AAD3D3D6_9STRA|nr:hypothetical protein CTEN210_12286 [Chaetoceros tenuissimus]
MVYSTTLPKETINSSLQSQSKMVQSSRESSRSTNPFLDDEESIPVESPPSKNKSRRVRKISKTRSKSKFASNSSRAREARSKSPSKQTMKKKDSARDDLDSNLREGRPPKQSSTRQKASNRTLPNVMLRQTRSSRLRDAELSRQAQLVRQEKSKALQQDLGFMDGHRRRISRSPSVERSDRRKKLYGFKQLSTVKVKRRGRSKDPRDAKEHQDRKPKRNNSLLRRFQSKKEKRGRNRDDTRPKPDLPLPPTNPKPSKRRMNKSQKPPIPLPPKSSSRSNSMSLQSQESMRLSNSIDEILGDVKRKTLERQMSEGSIDAVNEHLSIVLKERGIQSPSRIPATDEKNTQGRNTIRRSDWSVKDISDFDSIWNEFESTGENDFENLFDKEDKNENENQDEVQIITNNTNLEKELEALNQKVTSRPNSAENADVEAKPSGLLKDSPFFMTPAQSSNSKANESTYEDAKEDPFHTTNTMVDDSAFFIPPSKSNDYDQLLDDSVSMFKKSKSSKEGMESNTRMGEVNTPNSKSSRTSKSTNPFDDDVDSCPDDFPNDLPRAVSNDDDNNDEVSDVSESMLKTDMGPSLLPKQIENGDWEDLYNNLEDIKHSPQQIIDLLLIGTESNSFHTTAWKAPPPLAAKLYELLRADETEILNTVDSDGNTPMHLCCGNLSCEENIEDIEEVEQRPAFKALSLLLEKSPESLDVQNNEGDTPIHLFLSSPLISTQVNPRAGEQKDTAIAVLKMIKKKITSKETWNIRDSSGACPLHVAVGNGAHDDVVLSIIRSAPLSCRVQDERGMIPLHYVSAFRLHGAEVVLEMMKKYSNAICHTTIDGDTPLHTFIRNYPNNTALDLNAIGVLKLLLGDANHGGSLNERYCPLLMENREKLTPLHCFALFQPTREIGTLLMEHPAAQRAILMTNMHGSNPLHIVLGQSPIPIPIMNTLLTAESAMGVDNKNQTPLHVAVQNPSFTSTVLSILINANPLASSKDMIGNRLPIHLALHSNSNLEVVKALHESNPTSIEKETQSGDLCLHIAAANNAPRDIIEFLVNQYQGAIFKPNHLGDLPLHCAIENRASLETVKMLLKESPQGISTQNRIGNTPLHCLLQNNPSILEMDNIIINTTEDDIKAATRAINMNGKSPVDIAIDLNVPQDVLSRLRSLAMTSSKNQIEEWGSFDDLR